MKNLDTSSVIGALAGGVLAYLMGAGRFAMVIGVSSALMAIWLVQSYLHHQFTSEAGPPWFSPPSFFIKEEEDDSE